MKRVLILSASIGSGHIKAAEAVAEELRRQQPELELICVDFMSREVSLVHWLLKKLYLLMLALMPDFYDRCYKFAGGRQSGKLSNWAFACVTLPALRKLVRRYEPDMVFCTHPFPEGAASMLKQHGVAGKWKLAAAMTDYSLHQIWLYKGVDAYFMATEAMREGMLELGYEPARLHVTGIPVSSSLQALPDKAAQRRMMGLEELPTVLLMGGGLGLGGIEHTLAELEALPERLQLLVIAGHNKKLLTKVQELAQSSQHLLKVWGYTDTVHALMRASDLLITKPGALTISEAFVLGLPMLLHDPIPGPETENAVYATKWGAAVWLHPGERLAPAVADLLSGKLAAMGDCALACARPGAAAAIAEVLGDLQ